jgi:hypothetical protein
MQPEIIGERDDVEEGDLTEQRLVALLEERAAAGRLRFAGVDQPVQLAHSPPHEAGTRRKRLKGGFAFLTSERAKRGI